MFIFLNDNSFISVYVFILLHLLTAQMKRFVFSTLFTLVLAYGYTQPATAAKHALIITRMAAKYHVQPKPLDEAFSINVYESLLQHLDEEKLFFTQEDMKILNVYYRQLQVQVQNQKTDFLQLLTQIYQQRLQQVDTMLIHLTKQPFNLNVAEKYTEAEDTSYAVNYAALRNKWYKNLKWTQLIQLAALQELIQKQPAAKQKKYTDSLEAAARASVYNSYKRFVQKKLSIPGGVAQLVGNSYCKVIASYYDPHTNYLTLTEREDLEGSLGNKNLVFGFSLEEDEAGHTIIADLKPGTPAFKSGMMNKGDRILAIQWDTAKPIDVSDASALETSEILSASNHAQATLTLQKADGTKRQVILNKEADNNDDDDDRVKSFLLQGDKKIGYISLPSFYQDWENEASINGCANDVAKEIVKLKKDNIEGLILDVRYNGGGSVGEAIDLAGIFIDAGPVMQFKQNNAKIISLKDANRGTIYDGPLVLLVNGYSASASELLAGTLQDYNRALIVGSTTYGKATGQRILPLDTSLNLSNFTANNMTGNAFIKLTLSQLYRVNGQTAQFNGVIPDVHVADPTEAVTDKERNMPFAIPAIAIEPNKYYQPLKPLNKSNLQAIADAEQKQDSFFVKVAAFIAYQQASSQQKDIPLKLSDYIAFSKLQAATDDGAANNDATDNNTKAPFTIEENSFNQQKMKAFSGFQKNSDAVKRFLQKDGSIRVAYRLIKEIM